MRRWCLIALLLGAASAVAAPKKTYPPGVVHPVQSKRFAWVFYEKESRTLVLGLPAGAAREYYDVPQDLYDTFMQTRIKGGIYASRIEKKFPSAKVWVKQRR